MARCKMTERCAAAIYQRRQLGSWTDDDLARAALSAAFPPGEDVGGTDATLVERLKSVAPVSEPHHPENVVKAWNWLVVQYHDAAACIKKQAAQIAALKAKAEAAEARASELEREVERKDVALREIANQKKTDELETEYDVETASFEDGYDLCIDRARAALSEEREAQG